MFRCTLSVINHTECFIIVRSGSSELRAPCELSRRGGECACGVGALAAGDLGRVGDEAAAVRPLRGGLAAAEDLHEERLELCAEDAVDEDVDGGVDGDEEVGDLADLAEPLGPLDVDELLEDVADEGEHVAEEEDDHDDEEHHSQVVVLLLLVAQDRPRGVRPPDMRLDIAPALSSVAS